MNTEINQDYDLNELLGRGRQLRSAAVREAFAGLYHAFKGILAAGEPAPKPSRAV